MLAIVGAGYYILKTPQKLSGEKPKIAATIFPLFDIARNITGDKIDIIQIVPAGASPHTFEVTPQVVLKLQGVAAILKIGVLDDWIDDVASSNAPGVKVVQMSGLVQLRHFSDGSIDPHIWLDLNNDKIIAQKIVQLATEIDPNDAELFKKNLDSYTVRLDRADSEIKNDFAGFTNRNIATFHDAWNYFANRYGINTVASFEPFPGKEPTPEYLASFIGAVKKYGLKAVFVEPQFSSQSIEQVASDNGIRIVTINPADGGGIPSDDFIKIMENNAASIRSVLQLQQ